MEEFKKYKRVFVIVYDSLGVGGNDPMAKKWNDQGSNTYKHINEKFEIKSPVINSLGIKDLAYETKGNIIGHAFRSLEKSNGKDTITGHWEMMGLETVEPFPTYMQGFPKELIKTLEEKFGREIVGNKAASGIPILKELASEEINNNKVIVYTSSDSVLQICGHEEHMGLDTLYKFCDIAREVCSSKTEWNMARIIARPYIGNSKDDFKRTSNRKDLAVPPFKKTVLDIMQENKVKTVTVGKIGDIFSNNGIDESIKTKSNKDGLLKTIDIIKNKDMMGFIFVNLVDFDSLFGHQRDVEGYKDSIEEADVYLNTIIKSLNNDDLLIVTADHGNDPTWEGNDHTRELIPIMTYSPSMKKTGFHNDINNFGDIGATILDNFNIKPMKDTKSFLDILE